MNPDYSDITGLAGEPKWWDENAVPRYREFHPRECGVYNDHVALMVVRCQGCGTKFTVASERQSEAFTPEKEHKDPWDQVGAFHYGDPPSHGCIGDSMNVVPVQVVEFWTRDKDWNRVPGCEFICNSDED